MPLKVIIEMIKSAVPLLLRIRLLLAFVPTVTVPRSIEVELKDNCGSAVAVTVPVRFMTAGVVPESPCTFMVPLTGPAFVPFIQTVKLAL